MKLALDPYMLRTTPLTELPGVVAELGYEWIELSPREDFTPFFLHPRAGRDTVAEVQVRIGRCRGADRLTPAALPLVRPGRGRAAGRRAVLEAGHPAHRRPRTAG